MKLARDYLIELYTDYINNWISVNAFAEHHGLSAPVCRELLIMAREIRNSPHPDA